jgi:hypothetical protein
MSLTSGIGAIIEVEKLICMLFEISDLAYRSSGAVLTENLTASTVKFQDGSNPA